MNVHMEMHIGHNDADLLKQIKEWVLTQVPQPFIWEKDLQAPHAKEIGFPFCCDPLMRDRVANKALNAVVSSLAISQNETPVKFWLLSRCITDGVFDKPDSKERVPMLKQNRALHVEVLMDDKSRAKACIQVALKDPQWE